MITKKEVEDFIFRYNFKKQKGEKEKKSWYKKGNLAIYFEYDFLKFSYSIRYIGKNTKSERKYLNLFVFYSTLNSSEKGVLLRNLSDGQDAYYFFDNRLFELEKNITEYIEYINKRIELRISVHGEKAKITKIQTTKQKLEAILHKLRKFKEKHPEHKSIK